LSAARPAEGTPVRAARRLAAWALARLWPEVAGMATLPIRGAAGPMPGL
jgi:hypothetical protein